MEDEKSKLRKFLAAQGLEGPEAEEKVGEAIKAIHKLTGTTQVQYGPTRWMKFVDFTWPRWRHRLGIHQMIQSYEREESGAVRYLGLRCWICGHQTGA